MQATLTKEDVEDALRRVLDTHRSSPWYDTDAAAAYDLGADDLIVGEHPTPALAEEAALRLRRQIERKRRSDRQRRSLTNGLRLAMTDPLTGLHNRRYAMPQLLRMAENARDAGHPIAVMVLDLDRFKSINDTWGHGTGDTVLVEVARRLRKLQMHHLEEA